MSRVRWRFSVLPGVSIVVNMFLCDGIKVNGSVALVGITWSRYVADQQLCGIECGRCDFVAGRDGFRVGLV